MTETSSQHQYGGIVLERLGRVIGHIGQHIKQDGHSAYTVGNLTDALILLDDASTHIVHMIRNLTQPPAPIVSQPLAPAWRDMISRGAPLMGGGSSAGPDWATQIAVGGGGYGGANNKPEDKE